MSWFVLPVSLAVSAVILIILGIGNSRNYSIFAEDTEDIEAKVTAIKRAISSDAPIYNLYAEYRIDGRLIKGHHFVNLFESMIDCSEGDIITVKVNGKHPNKFLLPSYDISGMKRNSLMIIIAGVVMAVLSVGAFILAKVDF